MVIKLFVLGCPGSGKSTIARHIVEHVRQEHQAWYPTHFNDYEILHRMFEKDTEHKLFWPGSEEHGGFIVRERAIYHNVLKKLEETIAFFYSINDGLAIIEFARNDYGEAFKQFDSGFLRDAYFLFLDADLNTCIQRTRERILDARTKDDYFVPEHVFEYYYRNKNKEYLGSPFFRRQYAVEEMRVKIINTARLPQDCNDQIEHFVSYIYERECEAFNALQRLLAPMLS